MLYYLVVTLYVIVCFLLILTILLQQGKGGDIANAFGGGGGSQAVFGARSGATLLTRATSVLAALFVIFAIALTVIGQRGPGSVVGGIEGPPPAPVVPTNTTAPAEAPAVPPASGNKTP
jgi:preprotein translocase subunit SecG